jgi:uncharacterized protein YlaN (UPF0358 family)
LNRFVIHDVAQFCEAVLPRFFQHANWTSFTRQLANYSFVHVRDTDDAWVFEHPHFSRDAPATLPLVVRRKSNQANANNDVADTSDDAAATTATATASSSIVTRKRAFEKSLAVETDDDRVHSLEMIAQHGALLKSLHEKLDAQLAGQERVLQNQARIVELLEAQERRQLMRTLEGTASSLFSSTRLASTTSLFDLDSDAGAFCPIHNHS